LSGQPQENKERIGKAKITIRVFSVSLQPFCGSARLFNGCSFCTTVKGVAMAEIFTFFDPTDYLKSDEAILAFLSEAFASRDPQHIADAIGIVCHAKGMSEIARKASLNREDLYYSLSQKGNPHPSNSNCGSRRLGD